MKTYQRNIDNFCEGSICKNNLSYEMIAVLEAHTNLGEALQLLYGDSIYRKYAVEVAKSLAQS